MSDENRRKITLRDHVIRMGDVSLSIVAICGLAGLFFSIFGNPLVMAGDFEAYKKSTERRLKKIEGSMIDLNEGQLRSQQIALQTRIQDLEREIFKLRPDDPLKTILLIQKTEAEQDITRVKRSLDSLQRAKEVMENE